MSYISLPFNRSINHEPIIVNLNTQWCFRHYADEQDHAWYDQNQDRAIDVKRNSRINGSGGAETVRYCLTQRFKGPKKATRTCRLLYVWGEGAEDPVQRQLRPVAGHEDDQVRQVGPGPLNWFPIDCQPSDI